MNYAKLKSEHDLDPEGRGYAGMTPTGVAVDMNLKRKSRVRGSMSGDEVFCQTDTAEFAGLQAAKRDIWVAFCGRDFIDPADGANVDFVKWVFGDPSATLGKLNTARMESFSRAEELGLGTVKAGHIERVRT